jgi:hypothetical protein
MTSIINRILVWLAVHLQMVIVADWTPQPHVHLFKNYKDACNYAWHPEHVGTEIIDTRLFPEWVEPLRTELGRE